jgi:3',5'-nucleoside bisphosphate phosphatase
VSGIEISAVADGRDVHVLGYFIDTSCASLRDFLDSQRQERRRRVRKMGDRLAALGYPVDVSSLLDGAFAGRSVGRPQIAAAMVDAGYVATRDEAFARFLEFGGPAFVARRGAAPEAVVGIIHACGGLASLAHPGVTKRDALIAPLSAAGLDALEARHSDHDAATEAHYRAQAATFNLLVTGGSDFHGDTGHRTPHLGSVTLAAEDFERLRIAATRGSARR